MLCLPCLGTGKFPGSRTCPRCKGNGELPDTRLDNPMCAYCVGRGRDPFRKGKLCSICDGWGRMPNRPKPRPPEDAPSAAAAPGPAHATMVVDAGRHPVSGPYPTDPRDLEELLDAMLGDVEVCDPWLSTASLDRLRLLSHCDMIRVLTQDVEVDVLRTIREFTRELPRFLFRRYQGREIRDRYLLMTNEIVFLRPDAEDGNGGSPEFVRVPVDVAGEMIQEVRIGFNRLWGAGHRLG